MQNVNWQQVLVFGLVVLVVVIPGLGFLLPLLGAGFGLMGRGMMGPGGMRGGWCPWCGGTGRLGGGLLGPVLGLTFTCLLPLGLLGLLIAGGIWLARNTGRGGPSSRPSSVTCPSCDRLVEPDWRNCPYCGEDLQIE
jgi:hypothetical protein